jgi:hypothetical protein
MIFRLAKNNDIDKIVNIHLECSLKQKDGFMYKLGYGFLKSYYKILLEEKNSVVLIAEDFDGNICGFHSGSINPEEHSDALRKKSFNLFSTLLIKILFDPKLLFEIIERRNSLSTKSNNIKYSSKLGPRAEYWAWSPSFKGENQSVNLKNNWCKIIQVLGYDYYYLEVDSNNKLVLNYYKLQKAEVIEELILKDGRKRFILKLKTINN